VKDHLRVSQIRTQDLQLLRATWVAGSRSTAPWRQDQDRGPAGTEVDLTIERKDVDRPLQVTVMREVIYGPTVKLRVRLAADKLMIESTGA
jgi:hypothetical protein